MTVNGEEAAVKDRTGTAMIYTDGACIGNPGPGGYAAVILIGNTERIITGRDPDTTNNRMELFAAIRALDELPKGLAAVVTSDSQYLVNQHIPKAYLARMVKRCVMPSRSGLSERARCGSVLVAIEQEKGYPPRRLCLAAPHVRDRQPE